MRILDERLGPDHYLTAYCRIQRGSMLRRAGELDRAERVLREAVAAHERTLGAVHPNTTVAVNQLALTLADLGRFREAEPLLLQSYEVLLAERGQHHEHTRETASALARLYDALGKPDQAGTWRQRVTRAARPRGPRPAGPVGAS